jgi:hypothetical protein
MRIRNGDGKRIKDEDLKKLKFKNGNTIPNSKKKFSIKSSIYIYINVYNYYV